jgi:Holliday junction resolvase RusA-like endonuclease
VKITLLGEPLSTNNIYRIRHRYGRGHISLSQAAEELKEDYQLQALTQRPATPLTEGLKLTIKLFFGTKRKSDWDNFHKLSMDALTGIVWEDDRQIEEATVMKRFDKANPRIEITIEVIN